MKVLKPLLGSGAMTLGMAVSSLAASPRTPPGTLVPVHWSGTHADGFVAAPLGLWVTPLLAAALCGLFAGLPAVMPRSGRLERSETGYVTVWLCVIGFLALLHAATLASVLGAPLPVGRLAVGAVGALLLVLGNFLGKVRYNYVFGVRTPWTLASERVWDRTHRFMGPVFMAWGAAVLVCALVGADGDRFARGLLAGGAGLIVVLACGYSYRAARQVGEV